MYEQDLQHYLATKPEYDSDNGLDEYEYNKEKYDKDSDNNTDTEDVFIKEDSRTFTSPFKLIRPIRVFAIDKNGIAHPKIVAQRTFCLTFHRHKVYYSKYCKQRKQWLRWIGNEDEEFNRINNIKDEPSPKRCKRDACHALKLQKKI